MLEKYTSAAPAVANAEANRAAAASPSGARATTAGAAAAGGADASPAQTAPAKAASRPAPIAATANARADRGGNVPPGAGAPHRRDKPRFKLGWFKALLILVGLLVMLSRCGGGSPEDKQACLTALGQGNKLLARGDVTGAGIQSANANAYCRGDTRAKAEQLQTAVAKAENAGTACARALKAIDTQLDNHQLDGARSRLDKLDKKCAADASAKKLRQRLATAQNAANSAAEAVRRALNQRDAGAAAKAIERLEGLNRDADDLGSFRKALATLQAEKSAAAVAPVATPAVKPAPQLAATAPPVTATQIPAATAATPALSAPVRTQAAPAVRPEVRDARAEMAVSFIQDAEAALSQGRFDAARTYLDSARRMDPNSPRLDAVGRQVRDRERQMMQQETAIR